MLYPRNYHHNQDNKPVTPQIFLMLLYHPSCPCSQSLICFLPLKISLCFTEGVIIPRALFCPAYFTLQNYFEIQNISVSLVHSFLLWVIFYCMNMQQFIGLPVDWHSCFFCFGAITNKGAICVQVFVWTYDFLSLE